MRFEAEILPKGLREDNGSVSFKVKFEADCYQDAERYLNGTYGRDKWQNLWSI
jgi:hypothetical protein